MSPKSDWNDFIDLPWSIYKGDDRTGFHRFSIAVKDLLDVKKNPFFKHAYMHPIVAYKDGKCVGRIVGVDRRQATISYHEEKTAFFGFFECIDDQSLANALFEEVAKWANPTA